MFYSGVTYQGLILVHDLCNKRSYENLWKWISDYLEATISRTNGGLGYSGGQYNQLGIPLLVVGTKNDIPATDSQQGNDPKLYRSDLIEKYGGESISVCAISPAEFMPNSSTSIAFNLFFNRVIDPYSGDSRQRNTLYATSIHSGSGFSSNSTPESTRPSSTPVPEPQKLSNQIGDTDSPIPIMDFATFTGGSSTEQITPSRTGSPLSQTQTPIRPVTPTGISTGTSTKSALRAQYERNRSVLNQYNAGVPVYTRNTTPKGF
jgi:hypothetical protein